jgi:hypothetical protein
MAGHEHHPLSDHGAAPVMGGAIGLPMVAEEEEAFLD